MSNAEAAAEVIDLALSSLSKGRAEPVEIKPEAVTRLRGAIDTLNSALDLRAVAEELLRLAQFLDTEKSSRTASRTMAGLAGHAAKLMHQIKGTLNSVTDAVAKAASRYKSFKADRPALAPRFDAARPKNSVSVDRLYPMRRV